MPRNSNKDIFVIKCNVILLHIPSFWILQPSNTFHTLLLHIQLKLSRFCNYFVCVSLAISLIMVIELKSKKNRLIMNLEEDGLAFARN